MRMPVRYTAATGFIGSGAFLYMSRVRLVQFDAFARFTETEIEGDSIFAVCQTPPGTKRVSPGSSLKSIGCWMMPI